MNLKQHGEVRNELHWARARYRCARLMMAVPDEHTQITRKSRLMDCSRSRSRLIRAIHAAEDALGRKRRAQNRRRG